MGKPDKLFCPLCGVNATYAHELANRKSMNFMLDASGATSGALGAHLLFPGHGL